MICLVGESASGKSTIERILVNKYGYEKIVTYTTRPPRPKEVDGIDYHFVSNKDFLSMEANNEFAETATYNGWHYGTAKKDCLNNKVIVVTPHGLRQLKKIPGLNIVSFYINVPRRDRLIKILQRGDNVEEAYRRSLSDVGQYDGISDEVDRVIHNPEYQVGADILAAVIDEGAKIIMEMYMNGKLFCGNRKCDKECGKNICHVPWNTPCNTEFDWKPDKDGNCKEYEPMEG